MKKEILKDKTTHEHFSPIVDIDAVVDENGIQLSDLLASGRAATSTEIKVSVGAAKSEMSAAIAKSQAEQNAINATLYGGVIAGTLAKTIGVGVLHKNGQLYTQEEWKKYGFAKEDGIAVAVNDPRKSFIISKDEIGGYQDYGGWNKDYSYFGGYRQLFNNCKTTTNESEAERYYSGSIDTDGIIKEIRPDNYFNVPPYCVPALCRKYIFGNGQRGYCPSLGEWAIVHDWLDDIQKCLTLIGGEKLWKGYWYWSSTQYDEYTQWYHSVGNGFNNSHKFLNLRVRAFSAFPSHFTTLSLYLLKPNGDGMTGKFTIDGKEYDVDDENIDIKGMIVGKTYIITAHDDNENLDLIGEITIDCDHYHTREITLRVDNTKFRGVGIKHVNGKVYTKDEWQNEGFGNDEACGVAVQNDTHGFCISPNGLRGYYQGYGGWNDNYSYFGGYGQKFKNCFTTDKRPNCLTDLNGIKNTDGIIAEIQPDEYFNVEPYCVPALCRNYEFADGSMGYCPSIGEWAMVDTMLDEIQAMHDILGFQRLRDWYWSSTQYNENFQWTYNVGHGFCNDSKGNYDRVRAFSAL